MGLTRCAACGKRDVDYAKKYRNQNPGMGLSMGEPGNCVKRIEVETREVTDLGRI